MNVCVCLYTECCSVHEINMYWDYNEERSFFFSLDLITQFHPDIFHHFLWEMNSWQSVIGVSWCVENMLAQAVRRDRKSYTLIHSSERCKLCPNSCTFIVCTVFDELNFSVEKHCVGMHECNINAFSNILHTLTDDQTHKEHRHFLRAKSAMLLNKNILFNYKKQNSWYLQSLTLKKNLLVHTYFTTRSSALMASWDNKVSSSNLSRCSTWTQGLKMIPRIKPIMLSSCHFPDHLYILLVFPVSPFFLSRKRKCSLLFFIPEKKNLLKAAH